MESFHGGASLSLQTCNVVQVILMFLHSQGGVVWPSHAVRQSNIQYT